LIVTRTSDSMPADFLCQLWFSS